MNGFPVSPSDRLLVAAFITFLGAAVDSSAIAQDDPAAASGQPILETRSFWRCHFTLQPPVLTSTEAEKTEGSSDDQSRISTSPPPTDWMQTDFADRDWLRTPGPIFGGYGFLQPETVSLICLRGNFAVTDLDRVKDLKLSCAFRGGIVVYLNGREIARSHLGKDGIAPASLAEPYRLETYSTPGGTVIRWGWRDPETYRDRCNERIRRLTGIALPPGLLRSGVNVLALEIHRAPILAESRRLKGAHMGRWNTAGFVSAELTASSPDGLTPNVGQPEGLQVETLNSLVAVFDQVGYADPNEPLGPLHISAARNGVFSGQIVVRNDVAIPRVRAEISELRLADGTCRIPAASLHIRYAQPTGQERGTAGRFAGNRDIRRFDALADAPLEDSRVHVVWLTVRVPADAVPGEYRGQLTLYADGRRASEVPVELKVSVWTLADSKDFASHLGLVQSPATVALQYQVPLWSEEHFALVEKSLDLLGQVGNDVVFVPLVCKTHFGNDQTMVRWIRRDDGSYTHDYSVFDRYLDLTLRHSGKPEVVCLYVWDLSLGGGYFGRTGKPPQGVTVSRLDPSSGKIHQMVGPVYGTPESNAFMKPVLDEIRQRLNRRGIDDGQIMLGIAGDSRPSPQVTELFAEIAPYARWMLNSHASADKINDAPVGLYWNVWGAPNVPEPDQERRYGWQNEPLIRGVFPRYGAGPVGPMWSHSPLAVYGTISEATTMAGVRGFGRAGADFWPVLVDSRGHGESIAGRYPDSPWHQLSIGSSTLSVLAPGPSGAVSTVRFEALRQGVQECEARIFIERALADAARRGKLSNFLIQQCQQVLDDRARMIRAVASAGRSQNNRVWQWYAATDWPGRATELFDAAAEVDQALAGE